MTYTIPAILTVTIMFTGIFALMPIYDASTVHTTILANAARPFSEVSTTGTLNNNAQTGTFTCSTGAVCLITEITLICQTAAATAAVVTITDVDVNGVDVFGATFGAPTNDEYMLTGSITTPPSASGDLCHVQTAADNELYSLFALMGAAGGGVETHTQAPIMLNGGETITILLTESSSNAVTVRVTVHGTFTGSTEPSAMAFA